MSPSDELQPGLTQATHLLQAGQAQDALDAAQRVALLAPTRHEPLLVVADALAALGRHADALDVLVQAQTLAPQSVTARLKHGKLLREMGQLDLAVDVLKLALAIDESHAEVAFELGKTSVMLDRPADAAEAFGLAAERRPDWPEALGNWGTALGLSGDVARSCDAFERALALQPDNGTWWFNLGLARWAAHQRAGALHAFHHAQRLKPGLTDSVTQALGRPLVQLERRQRLLRLLLALLPLLLLLAWVFARR